MIKLFSEIPCLQGERVTLRRLTSADADSLRALCECKEVYRYLPAFLFEQQYSDKQEVIRRLYCEHLPDSLILGVYLEDALQKRWENNEHLTFSRIALCCCQCQQSAFL